jgi:hypothetical protein
LSSRQHNTRPTWRFHGLVARRAVALGAETPVSTHSSTAILQVAKCEARKLIMPAAGKESRTAPSREAPNTQNFGGPFVRTGGGLKFDPSALLRIDSAIVLDCRAVPLDPSTP